MPVQTVRVTEDCNYKLSRQLKVVRLSALRAGRIYTQFC